MAKWRARSACMSKSDDFSRYSTGTHLSATATGYLLQWAGLRICGLTSSPSWKAIPSFWCFSRVFPSKGCHCGPTFIRRCRGLFCGCFSRAHLCPGTEGEAVAGHRVCPLHRELSLVGREVFHQLLSQFGSVNWRERQVEGLVPAWVLEAVA